MPVTGVAWSDSATGSWTGPRPAPMDGEAIRWPGSAPISASSRVAAGRPAAAPTRRGRRRERLGARPVARPAPGADGRRGDPLAWFRAVLRFQPGRGWTARGGADPSEAWPVAVDGLTMELRPTSSGGLGLYPEHAANL